MANRWRESGSSGRFYFLGLQNHWRWWLKSWNQKALTPWKKSYDKPRKCIKKQKHYLAYKGLSSYSYGFSSSHVWMWELNHKEVWAPQNWCFWIVVLEKTLESPFHCKELKPVNPKGNQYWIFVGRTDVEAETPVFDHLMWRNNSLEKTDAGKDRWWEEKGMTEDEKVGWHQWFDRYEFE